MAYDEGLAERARKLLVDLPGFVEKKMFGGIGFMLRGNMACGVNGNELIVRVGPANYEQALGMPYTRPFDMTGRPMRGWVMVAPASLESDAGLQDWVQRGVEFALSLPEK